MFDLIWLIPALPLAGFFILLVTTGRLPAPLVKVVGAGSVGLAALVAGIVACAWLGSGHSPYITVGWTWMQMGGLSATIGLAVDGLSLTMVLIVTGVGFLIHLYSTGYMDGDEGISRYFAFMNLFVAGMLLLVLADNLLLLYLGWELVGLCSYLLIGFWYTDPENGRAARKAFVVTRIGDVSLLLGVFLLLTQLGTLDIGPMVHEARHLWQPGTAMPTIAALLLLGGAVGKSAQLPLQTWLPDAMAGPTPVSALIHAATMVTAGVYLIARTHALFMLAPEAQLVVGIVGVLTLLLASCSALVQTDIKRILAYSTISQIGYMFVALGVGAWSAGIFHLMTHAFFKALLFLGAGAVIVSLHHEQDIFKMGGLRKRLPVAFWSMLIGCGALAAIPWITAGYYSKDDILLSAWNHGVSGRWFWAGGVLGAFLTAIYSFRLVFIVFFGEVRTEPDRDLSWTMAVPLIILSVFSIAGGWIHLPLQAVFPASPAKQGGLVSWVTLAAPLAGVFVAWVLFLVNPARATRMAQAPGLRQVRQFWFSQWGMDWLYDLVFVRPWYAVTRGSRTDLVNWAYRPVAGLASLGSTLMSFLQTGYLRWYAATLVVGVILLIAMDIGVI